ncbi:MAG: DUF2935 domain-containing protein [Carboxydocellales bacterium]
MISLPDYIRKSLETNLFFARIMKEHVIFLEAGFVCKDEGPIRQADNFKNAFNAILCETVNLANGVVSQDSLAAQEFVTNNTLAAEQKTQNLSGIPIDLNLTKAEMALVGDSLNIAPQLQGAVHTLNQKAIAWSAAIADFKGSILNSVLACNLFTWNFPLLLDHVRREALMYNMMLTKLQNAENPDDPAMAAQLEAFWNRIMADHSLFIRNYLDPTEENLFATAQNFANQFKQLTAEAEAADQNAPAVEAVTRRSLVAAQSIRDFKKQGTELILMCRIKSLINPLLGDHVTREANHFIRLLRKLAGTV